MRFLSVLLLTAVLAGCGFHLRGSGNSQMPYKTMYIALPETADVRIWMQRYISAGGSTRIVDSAAEAEAVFQQLQDSRGQTILSVNAQGRARELRLTLTYRFRIVDAKGRELVGPNEVSLSRDVTYDDSNVLAKDLEQSLLWRDMNNDLVNQIVRRLSIIKPKNPDLESDD
jgi:LPS-assembly lipoprotein